MAETSSCNRCGESRVDGHCDTCDRRSASAFVHREIVALVLLCALVAAGFVVTRAAARENRTRRLRDAATWYGDGERELAGGRTAQAIAALRRATAIDRDNTEYRLALAAGLAADRQDEAARQVLLGVREAIPEDPRVNLRLARLAARGDDVPAAERYYHNAVYGAWSGEQDDARRLVRIELIRYLLDRHQPARALSELLVLAAGLPDDTRLQTEAGQLFVEAGDPRRGLDRFRQALRLDPTSRPALVGAGRAAFETGDYASAQRYLRGVEPASSDVSELLDVIALVLTGDPLRPGLSLPQRQSRVRAGLARALTAADACARRRPGDEPTFESVRAEAEALAHELALDRLRRAPESIDAGLDLIYRIEQLVAAECGQGSAFDRALILIGRRHDSDRQ